MMSSNNEDIDILQMVNEDLELENAREAELAEIRSKEELFQSNLDKNNVWGYSNFGMHSKQMAMQMLATRHGMYAKIPLACKAESCPYSETCMLLKYGLAPEGEPCTVETSEIELRIKGYADDFGLDEASFTDRVMVSEIVNLDILIERCKALMAKEGMPVIDVVAGIDDHGNVLMRPEVSKAVDAYDKFTEKRNKLYGFMLATRKDKKTNTNTEVGIHTIITKALEQEANDGFVIDQRPDNL